MYDNLPKPLRDAFLQIDAYLNKYFEAMEKLKQLADIPEDLHKEIAKHIQESKQREEKALRNIVNKMGGQ